MLSLKTPFPMWNIQSGAWRNGSIHSMFRVWKQVRERVAEDLSRSQDSSQKDIHLSPSFTSFSLPSSFPLLLSYLIFEAGSCLEFTILLPQSLEQLKLQASPPQLLKDWKYTCCKELQHTKATSQKPYYFFHITQLKKPELKSTLTILMGNSKGKPWGERTTFSKVC